MQPDIRAHGKQLLQGTRHLADCRDEGVACALALIMQRSLITMLEPEEVATIRKAFGR